MGIVFNKESNELYSAFFISDPGKRKAALDKWVQEAAPVIQTGIIEELQSIIDAITINRWTEDGWRTGAKKLRKLQYTYQIALDIKLRPFTSNDKFRGEKHNPVIPKIEIDLHEKNSTGSYSFA